jgi:hypothetical protein
MERRESEARDTTLVAAQVVRLVGTGVVPPVRSVSDLGRAEGVCAARRREGGVPQPYALVHGPGGNQLLAHAHVHAAVQRVGEGGEWKVKVVGGGGR